MNKIETSLIWVLVFFTSFQCQSQIKKYTEYEVAKSEAMEQDKDILIVLTGSDWCKPCIKMKKNVFENADFINFAEKNLIIFEVNLDRHWDLDSKLYKDYSYFKNKYQTNTLPCLVLIDKNEVTKSIISEGLTSFEKTFTKLNRLTK
jgi:thioredoxin-related protein